MAFPNPNQPYFHGVRNISLISYQGHNLYVTPNPFHWSASRAVSATRSFHEPQIATNRHSEHQCEYDRYFRVPGPSHKKWGPVPTQVILSHPHLLRTLESMIKSSRGMPRVNEYVAEHGKAKEDAKEMEVHVESRHSIKQHVNEGEPGLRGGGEEEGDEVGGIELGYGEDGGQKTLA